MLCCRCFREAFLLFSKSFHVADLRQSSKDIVPLLTLFVFSSATFHPLSSSFELNPCHKRELWCLLSHLLFFKLCCDEKHPAGIRFLELCLTAPGVLCTINPLWPGAGAVRQSSRILVIRMSIISVVHFNIRSRILPVITLPPRPFPLDLIFMRSHLSFPTTPNSDANAYSTPRKQKHEGVTSLLRLPDSRGGGDEARLKSNTLA